MTAERPDGINTIVHRRALLIERLSYGLILLPTLTEYLENGSLPRTPRDMITEFVIGALILGFILLIRSARRQMVRLEGLRRTLTSALIHDLKNPLTSIVGTLYMIREKDLGLSERSKLLDLSMEACNSQVQLIDNLLDVDRLEVGDLVPRVREIDAPGLVTGCIEASVGAAAFKGVALAGTAPEAGPPLRADPDLLRRVLLNLIQNALKYTPRGGRVSVSAAHGDGVFIIEVSDTGAGIPPEHIGKLFAKFYRVEGSDRSARPGTGLGLYFCRLAVEAHGGKIGIDSELRHGTTIWLRLPQPAR